jgi:hypothetical protein
MVAQFRNDASLVGNVGGRNTCERSHYLPSKDLSYTPKTW